MDVTFQIDDTTLPPSVLAAGDLSRRALEAFALGEFKANRISKVQLRKMLGLERIELDGFFQAHGVFEEYTLEDFERERQSLKELGF